MELFHLDTNRNSNAKWLQKEHLICCCSKGSLLLVNHLHIWFSPIHNGRTVSIALSDHTTQPMGCQSSGHSDHFHHPSMHFHHLNYCRPDLKVHHCQNHHLDSFAGLPVGTVSLYNEHNSQTPCKVYVHVLISRVWLTNIRVIT